MLKQELLTLINEFEKETWKYKQSDELYSAMEYVYTIENELKRNENLDIKHQ